jgi:homoserine kinase
MNEITIRVPATSANLGPGFDTLGLALALYNTITIRERHAGEPPVVISGEGRGLLSCDERNLAYSSARQVFQMLGVETDFALHMHNDVPLSRGLGSSATARVGGIVAANEWARQLGHRVLDCSQLLSLASKLEGHPDNAAAALLGGFVASCVEGNGDAEQAFAVQVPVKKCPQFAVWIPDEPLPTKQARAVVPTQLSREDAVFNISRAALLVAALTTGDWDALSVALHDRIHQNQRAPLIHGYAEVTGAATEAGAIGATLSGAGSTILLWCVNESSTHAEIETAVRDVAQRNNFRGRFLWLAVDESGAAVDNS